MNRGKKKIYTSTVFIIIFLILFLLSLPWLFSIFAKIHKNFNTFLPDEGIWHCDELSMTLDFEGGFSYAMYRGMLVKCNVGQEHGDYNGVILETQWNRVNKTVFFGHCVDAEANRICIIDDETGTKYWFIRVSKDTAQMGKFHRTATIPSLKN